MVIQLGYRFCAGNIQAVNLDNPLGAIKKSFHKRLVHPFRLNIKA
jgi:hypothetical protein